MNLVERQHKRNSLALTTALFGLLLLLMVFIKLGPITQLMELEGGGGGGAVAVNFGDSDFGSGTNFTSVEAAAASRPQPKSTANEMLLSEADDAPVIKESRRTPVKDKKEEVAKPVERPAPTPSKSTTDALSNLLGSSNSGDGNDNRAGNKGQQSGNVNDRGYDGTGGSGTGSGGGQGSGQGIGTGSGYGSGSGSGSGSGHGNYQLAGRKFLSTPAPRYTCNEQGTVVVQITVDKNGKVIAAQPGIRGTTNSAQCLLEQARIAALNTVVNPSSDAPDRQVGKIIYNFKLTD